jgi:hypothetical protein
METRCVGQAGTGYESLAPDLRKWELGRLRKDHGIRKLETVEIGVARCSSAKMSLGGHVMDTYR